MLEVFGCLQLKQSCLGQGIHVLLYDAAVEGLTHFARVVSIFLDWRLDIEIRQLAAKFQCRLSDLVEI